MNKERKRRRRGVTPRSPEGRRMVPEGVHESAMLILKRAFSDETMGVGDTEYWVEIENKASSLTPRQVCFQYHLVGVGPAKLAKLCLESLPAYRRGAQIGDIDKEQQHNLLTGVTHLFLSYYPPKYKKEYQ